MPNNKNCGTGSLLDRLDSDSEWIDYLTRKEDANPNDPELDHYWEMFRDEDCRRVCSEIASGKHAFSIPRKSLIAKGHSNKKRTVYQYDKYETMALRLLAGLLHEYDYLFADNLFSFRRGKHVGDAVRILRREIGKGRMWGCKMDIHDYFNSINIARLLEDLRDDMNDDRLFNLFEHLLSDRRVTFHGTILEEEKGVMAGVPISAFLANYYLRKMDEAMSSEDFIYMRYADDILIMTESKETMEFIRNKIKLYIEGMGLEMNPDKECIFSPGERVEFLGFSVSSDEIDISENTKRKMKGKIRRSARSIRRWMLKKGAPVQGTVRALFRTYNHRFYGHEAGELSWARWYFPTITTTSTLHEIDLYLQQWARYVATGKHCKKNYKAFTYEMMRECGYRPLVSEYYNQN